MDSLTIHLKYEDDIYFFDLHLSGLNPNRKICRLAVREDPASRIYSERI